MLQASERVTDTAYEKDRGEAERQYQASFAAWLKTLPPLTAADFKNILRFKPEWRDAMLDLSESCSKFVVAELGAFTSSLERLGMASSQARGILEVHRKETMQETRQLKWEYGLTKICADFQRDRDAEEDAWSLVDRVVLDFVRQGLETRLVGWAGRAVGASSPQFEHSTDYRSVTKENAQYTLTALQAGIVKLLHEAFRNGTPDLGQDYILLEAEGGRRLRDAFKSNPEAWKALVVRGTKRGTYRLNMPAC